MIFHGIFNFTVGILIERRDEWFNEFSYYVNYPILNDRLAIVRGGLHDVTHMIRAWNFALLNFLIIKHNVTIRKRTIHFTNYQPVMVRMIRTLTVNILFFSLPILVTLSLQQIERKLIAPRVTSFAIKHRHLCLRIEKWLS